MKKGEMGNLIIVVGANNSGKSNVLDALTCFGNKKLERRDVTTLSYSEEDRKPSLALITKDGKKDSPEEYSYTIMYGQDNHNVKYPEIKKVKMLETKSNNRKVCEKRTCLKEKGYWQKNKLLTKFNVLKVLIIVIINI